MTNPNCSRKLHLRFLGVHRCRLRLQALNLRLQIVNRNLQIRGTLIVHRLFQDQLVIVFRRNLRCLRTLTVLLLDVYLVVLIVFESLRRLGNLLIYHIKLRLRLAHLEAIFRNHRLAILRHAARGNIRIKILHIHIPGRLQRLHQIRQRPPVAIRPIRFNLIRLAVTIIIEVSECLAQHVNTFHDVQMFRVNHGDFITGKHQIRVGHRQILVIRNKYTV